MTEIAGDAVDQLLTLHQPVRRRCLIDVQIAVAGMAEHEDRRPVNRLTPLSMVCERFHPVDGKADIGQRRWGERALSSRKNHGSATSPVAAAPEPAIVAQE